MIDAELRWHFGAFELDSRSRELLKPDGKLKLQEQPFQVLSALIEKAGEVVTREELRHKLWPGNTYVDFDNSLNVCIAKLRHSLEDNADRPKYIETLPRLGYRFIANVEQRPHVEPTRTPRAPRGRKFWVWGSAAALAIAGLAFLIAFANRPAAGTKGVTVRPSAAIMGFRNLSAKPEQDWLSTALAEMLATELGAGGHLRVIPGETIARAKIDMGLPETESFSPQTLTAIQKKIGADFVLVGSYLETDYHRIRLDLRLQDAGTGETVALPPTNGSEDDLTSLVEHAEAAVRRKLGTWRVTVSEDNSVRAELPLNLDSARLYAEGLNRLRHFDARGARDLLGQAVAADPNYALAHAALSDAWSALGYAEVAKNEARKAWQLSARLPGADRLAIEARYRETNSEWDRAIRVYQRLVQQYPDNADYSLRLAGAQINAGHPNDALATLDRLQNLPGPLPDYAAIQFVRSQAAESAGDFERAQSAAAGAAVAAHAREAQTLEADSRALECRQLVQLSRLDQAAAACEIARTIYAKTGNRLGLAASMAYLAAAYCNQGNSGEARELYTQALDINREIGNARGDAQWALNGLAVLLLQQGDLSGSRNLYAESLGMARLAGSRPDEAAALGNIGSTLLVEGDLTHARDLFDQALKRARSIGAKATLASALNNLGHTLYLLGNLTEAANMLDQAVRTDREIGSALECADALSWLGRVRLAQANWDEAKRNFEDSVEAATGISGQAFGAQYRLVRAELTLTAGTPTDAEQVIRNCLEIFQRARLPERELEARTLLARTLLSEGKVAEARQEVARGVSLAHASQRREARLAYAVVAARVEAASGQAASVQRATEDLQATVAAARRQGFMGYQLEARLALGEIEARKGNDAAARALLKPLERDARASGFQVVAQNAARALVKVKG